MHKAEKNQSQSKWNNNLEALGGGNQLFELAAPCRPVSGRNLHLLCNERFRFVDKGAEIAAAHICGNNCSAFAIFAAHLIGALTTSNLATSPNVT